MIKSKHGQATDLRRHHSLAPHISSDNHHRVNLLDQPSDSASTTDKVVLVNAHHILHREVHTPRFIFIQKKHEI